MTEQYFETLKTLLHNNNLSYEDVNDTLNNCNKNDLIKVYETLALSNKFSQKKVKKMYNKTIEDIQDKVNKNKMLKAPHEDAKLYNTRQRLLKKLEERNKNKNINNEA